jgi:hypothetical protein
LLEQEVQSDLLVGMIFTDRKVVIDLKARRERVLEDAQRKLVLDNQRETDQKVRN